MHKGGTGQNAQAFKVNGPGGAAVKYDILTALLVMAAQGDPLESRLALRLSLLITARYNWRIGSFAVGQRELARMWGVTERTAKRDMAAMRGLGWITVAIPAARGRVATYRIELQRVLRATMRHWDAVGPDFSARMVGAPAQEEQANSNVVPLRPDLKPVADQGTGWAAAAARLRAQDPSVYEAWFAVLGAVDAESGILTLQAPSRFHADYVRTHFTPRILAAIIAENPAIREVSIVSA